MDPHSNCCGVLASFSVRDLSVNPVILKALEVHPTLSSAFFQI